MINSSLNPGIMAGTRKDEPPPPPEAPRPGGLGNGGGLSGVSRNNLESQVAQDKVLLKYPTYMYILYAYYMYSCIYLYVDTYAYTYIYIYNKVVQISVPLAFQAVRPAALRSTPLPSPNKAQGALLQAVLTFVEMNG